MRTLSSELLAAQKALNVIPKVELIVRDQFVSVNRAHWQLLYSGSEPEGLVGGAQASDGSVIRARLEGTALKVQRVTDPQNQSQWASWSTLVSSGGCSTDSSPLVVADPQGADVWLFYVDDTGYTIHYFHSTDYGASWGSSSQQVAEPAGTTVTGLGGAIRETGADRDPYLFYCCNPPGGGSDSVIKYMKAGPDPGSPTAWPIAGKYLLKGVACVHSGDWNLLVAGREGESPYNWRLWAIVLGDGYSYAAGTWGELEEVLVSDNLSFTFQYPSLVYAGLHRALYQEAYSQSGGYARLSLFQGVSGADYVDARFTDTTPFPLSSNYSGVLAHCSGNYLYLLTAKKAYRAQIGTALSADVSDYVLRYRSAQTETGAPVASFRGRYPMVIELDNSAGTFAQIGQSGDSFEAIKRGSQVELSRGYSVGAASYTSPHPLYWIEDYEFLGTPQGGKLILYCIGGWELMERWRADRQYFWIDGEANVYQIASLILGFVGFGLSLKGESSNEITSFKPSLTIHAGESGRNALIRLFAKVPDRLFFFDDTAYAKELAQDESPCYSYGGSGEHPILAGRYRFGSAQHSQVQVFGQEAAFGEALDFAELELMGARRRKLTDYAYETASECLFRAEALLREAQVEAMGGEVRIRPNAGTELYDVISITDAKAGLSSLPCRVMAIIEEYDGPAGIYQQRLILGSQ